MDDECRENLKSSIGALIASANANSKDDVDELGAKIASADVSFNISYWLDQVALIFDILKSLNLQSSSLPQTFSQKQDVSEKDKPNGYAGLNAAGKIAASQLAISGWMRQCVVELFNLK